LGPNPFIGVIYHWIGGFASATNFIPFRGIKRWSWEVYWLIQGFAAWIVAPIVLAGLLVPHLWTILRGAPGSSFGYALLCGALWGVGGLTFGLAIRYLGIALGYAIALGLCTAFGTLIPPVYDGSIHVIMHEVSGQIVLAGVFLCLIAVAVNGLAGLSKEREVTAEDRAEAGEADFSFTKGISVAIFAGIMSSFFAFGLKAGAPIGVMTRSELVANHRLDLWQNLPVLIVVLWGGFVTNFAWSVVLIVKNRSARQFLGAPGSNPMRAGHATGQTIVEFDALDRTRHRISPKTLLANYVFASLAGVIWYLQFFFYSMGQIKMGKYDFSSWTLHMASIIIFATLWGLALREWRGTSRQTKMLVAGGLFLLVASTIVVGYGNYVKANESTKHVAGWQALRANE
jgi:L-rhamnose-H+ transport protein